MNVTSRIYLFINSCIILLGSLLLTTLILVASSILVMAEEFKSFPTYLQHASSMLVHNKQHRTIFICSVISLIALTSIVGVLACPTSIRRYPEAVELHQEHLSSPTFQPERLVAPTAGLDQFILTFLEAALRDESSEEQKDVSSRGNRTAYRSNSVEMDLTAIVNGRASPEKGRRRKEFFRFYRLEQRRELGF